MNFLSNHSAEDLARLLTIARWGLGVFAVLTAIAGLFTQYITDRISNLQQADKKAAEQRLGVAEQQIQTAETARRILEEKIAPRVLTDSHAEVSHVAALREAVRACRCGIQDDG